jgi:SAM-dependent methyltransferase
VGTNPSVAVGRDITRAVQQVAERFGGAARETILYENIDKHRYECGWMLQHAGAEGGVLDLGGGLGVNLLVLRALDVGQRLVLVDRFLEYTEENRMGERQRGLELLRAAGVEVIEQDFWAEPALPFGEDTFGVVTVLDVVEHLPGHPLRQLAEVRRVLKPGGRVLLSGPNAASLRKRLDLLAGRHPYAPFEEWTKDFYHLHHREYTPVEYARLLERAGLTVEERRTSHAVWVARSRNRFWRRPRSRLSPVVGGLYLMRIAEALLPPLRHTVYCSARKE